MTDEMIRNMILDIVGEIDYDILKNCYMEETAEEPDLVEDNIAMLMKIVKKYYLTDVKNPINSEGVANRKVTYCYRCGTHVKDQKYCHGCGHMLNWDALEGPWTVVERFDSE